MARRVRKKFGWNLDVIYPKSDGLLSESKCQTLDQQGCHLADSVEVRDTEAGSTQRYMALLIGQAITAAACSRPFLLLAPTKWRPTNNHLLQNKLEIRYGQRETVLILD